jgi:hypothetical protein
MIVLFFSVSAVREGGTGNLSVSVPPNENCHWFYDRTGINERLSTEGLAEDRARNPLMGSSQIDVLIHKRPTKVGGINKSMPKVDVSSAIPSCGRALPNALVEPDGLLRPLLRTPTPRCSGPREPGVAGASTARRGRFERPRRALAPRLPRPPELRGACGRAACAAPRRSARRRLPSVTAEPRALPRMRRCPSGRRPVERGGRDERLDGQGRVGGRK